jgi:hypothetical protein
LNGVRDQQMILFALGGTPRKKNHSSQKESHSTKRIFIRMRNALDFEQFLAIHLLGSL